MDRNIPHIRDIFSSSRKKSGEFQDLCVYEKSPRSRRKNKLLDFSNEPDQENKSSSSLRKKGDKGKENIKYKNSDEARLIQDTKNSNNNHNNNNNNQQQSSAKSYSSKTLTERDIRHLERHLSMKKTIRKQISRNLAQALVDNPNLFEPDTKKETARPDYGRSYTKSKLAKSEQAVLDMLKVSIDDRDSGHSSPTNEVLARAEEDDFADSYNGDDNKDWNSDHRNSETKLLTNEISDSKNYSPDKKSSIWKSMFSSRNKGKR